MKQELVRTSSTVGEANLHLQLTPAYRRDIFAREDVKALTIMYAKQKLDELGVLILAVDGGPDHMHIFLSNWKKYSVERLAQGVKGYVSRMMRKHHWDLFRDKLWGKKFWTEGYFYRTVGQVTKDATKYYVEKSQQKHWRALDYGYYKHSKERQMELAQYAN